MSLLTAVGGFEGAFQNPYVQDYNAKVRLKYGDGQQYADPLEINKIEDTDSFRAQLEARAAAVIERPTMAEMIERGVDHVDAAAQGVMNDVDGVAVRGPVAEG